MDVQVASSKDAFISKDDEEVVMEKAKKKKLKKLKDYLLPKGLKHKKKKKKKIKKSTDDTSDSITDGENRKALKRKKSSKRKKKDKEKDGLKEDKTPEKDECSTAEVSDSTNESLHPQGKSRKSKSSRRLASLPGSESQTIAAVDTELGVIPEKYDDQPKSSRNLKKQSSKKKKSEKSRASKSLAKGESMRTKKQNLARKVSSKSNRKAKVNVNVKKDLLRREFQKNVRKLILLNIFFEETAAKVLQAENNIDRKSFSTSYSKIGERFLEDEGQRNHVPVVVPDTKRARPRGSSIVVADKKTDPTKGKSVNWGKGKDMYDVKLIPKYSPSVKRHCFYTDNEIKKFRFENVGTTGAVLM
jgi:hypothetical protein